MTENTKEFIERQTRFKERWVSVLRLDEDGAIQLEECARESDKWFALGPEFEGGIYAVFKFIQAYGPACRWKNEDTAKEIAAILIEEIDKTGVFDEPTYDSTDVSPPWLSDLRIVAIPSQHPRSIGNFGLVILGWPRCENGILSEHPVLKGLRILIAPYINIEAGKLLGRVKDTANRLRKEREEGSGDS